MAGTKASRKKDESSKKRKRDANDSDTKAKRHHRQRARDSQTNGDEANGRQKNNEDTEALNGSKTLTKADAQEITSSGERAECWKVSKPMGGRMLDIDPILTEDEDYLILAYNTSIQVYGASDSLLVRRIPISTLDSSAPQGTTPSHIIATRLSKTNFEYVWVATSDGRVHHVRWTTSEPATEVFQTTSKSAKALTIVSASGGDVLLVAESEKASKMELVAYKADNAGNFGSKSLLTLKKPDSGLHIVESSDNGQLIAGAFQDRLFLGTVTSSWDDLAEVQVDFFSFDSPDIITCLDVRPHSKPSGAAEQAVDIIVGGARGGIYLYNDALSRVRAAGKPQFLKDGIQVQKYHWHRRAVHAVKWSHDGHYFISGGSENVLVSWQIDTSKKDFLPHLSGSVENIVVSPSGSSYVVHLDDNSAMILSTAELKPTAYVAGIQSAAIDMATPKDQLVRRLWNAPGQVKKPIPAAIRPTDPQKLHVCVGNGCQATLSGNLSAPLLQSFDLESFTSSSKHALARTQPTDVNITNKGHIIDEPLVTHIAFSGDGRWLASIDDWRPAARDVENVSGELKDQFLRERHEVYLKFWDMQGGADAITLVSRVNSPHATSCPETVLDMAADPSSSAFATIGSDAAVRVWRPRLRQQHGVAVKDTNGLDAVSWSCADLIEVGDGAIQNNGVDFLSPLNPSKTQGSVVFSDDGSTLFAAFGTHDTGAVYVIDVMSAEVVKTLEGLWDGKLQSIRTMGPYVITLSDDLRVYDVVSDELRYGIVIPKISGGSDLLQLAVDQKSGHFAVTLPIGGISSIGIFDPEVPEPLLVRSTPHRIVSLVSSPSASGFIALDDAAQVWVISEASELSSLTAAQPLQDMKLDKAVESEIVTSNGESEVLVDDIDMASEDGNGEEEADGDVEMGDDSDDDDDDDLHANVITQQALMDIFDAAPSFAAPSIEDLFYKVTGLLATKPLSAS